MRWFNYRSFALLFLCLLLSFSGIGQKRLIPYQEGNRWGFADSNGKVRIHPKFKRVRPFINGIAVVRDTNNRSGFINRKGKYLVPPVYDTVSYFWGGVYMVKRMNYSWVDSNGIASDLYFNEPIGFENGKAIVTYMGRQGLIGVDGKWLIEPMCRWLLKENNTYCDCAGDSNFVLYDENGKYLCTYHRSLGFIGNYAVSFEGKGFDVIDRTGKSLIPPGFQLSYGQYKGVPFILTDGKTGLLGLMDPYGKWIAEPRYRKIHYCNSSVAMQTGDSLWEIYVSRTGRWLRPKDPRIASVYCNPTDSAILIMRYSAGGRDGMRCNYMDSTGHFLFEKDYDYIERANGYSLATLGNTSEWYDKSGTCFLRRENRPGCHFYFFDERGYTPTDTIRQDINTALYGLADRNGTEVLPREYASIAYDKSIEKYLARKPDYSTVIFDPLTRKQLKSDYVPQVFRNGHYLLYRKLPDSVDAAPAKHKASLLNKRGEVLIDSITGFVEELGEHHFVTGKKRPVKVNGKLRPGQEVYDQKVVDLQGRMLFTLPDEPVKMNDGFFYFPRSGRYMRQDGLKFYTE